jgi:hypothetical protein
MSIYEDEEIAKLRAENLLLKQVNKQLRARIEELERVIIAHDEEILIALKKRKKPN